MKKGNLSPTIEDQDPRTNFTPQLSKTFHGQNSTLPTPPGSVFIRSGMSFPGFNEECNQENGYNALSPDLTFWNGNPNAGLPTGPLSFNHVKNDQDVDGSNSLLLDDEYLISGQSPQSSSKDESILVNFLHSGNPQYISPELMNANSSSNFESCFIFRDSSERSFFHS